MKNTPKPPSYLDDLQPVLVFNIASTDVPPFGVMAISTFDTNSGVILVTQPDEDGQTNVLFNGPCPILANSEGQAAYLPRLAAYTTANQEGAAPGPNEIWGAKAGSWFLNRHKPGFQCIGFGANGLVFIRPMTNRAMANLKQDGAGGAGVMSWGTVYAAFEITQDPVSGAVTQVQSAWLYDPNGGIFSGNNYYVGILVGSVKPSGLDMRKLFAVVGGPISSVSVVTNVCVLPDPVLDTGAMAAAYSRYV